MKIQYNKCAYITHEETCLIIHWVSINHIYRIQDLTNSASVSDTIEKW